MKSIVEGLKETHTKLETMLSLAINVSESIEESDVSKSVNSKLGELEDMLWEIQYLIRC